jgi:RNA polymerase sigma-70 factor (ECF subfamily)
VSEDFELASDAHPDAAFVELYAAVFARAKATARRLLGDESAAEDVASEAFVRAYDRWSQVRNHPSAEAWVLRTTTNLALKRLRRRMPQWSWSRSEPIAMEDQAAIRIAFTEALRRLPKRQREAIALKHLAGLTEREVASVMKVSRETVRQHLRRGGERLRRVLAHEEVQHLGS